MKILSVFHRGNEISIHTNLLGKKIITFNKEVVLEKFTLFNLPVLTFTAKGEAYYVKLGYHWSGGYGADIWNDDGPILLGLNKYTGRPRFNPIIESDYV
ncbi:MAG: hypothetical protein AAGJ82_04715 [Bacteroidota bacterium]